MTTEHAPNDRATEPSWDFHPGEIRGSGASDPAPGAWEPDDRSSQEIRSAVTTSVTIWALTATDRPAQSSTEGEISLWQATTSFLAFGAISDDSILGDAAESVFDSNFSIWADQYGSTGIEALSLMLLPVAIDIRTSERAIRGLGNSQDCCGTQLSPECRVFDTRRLSQFAT